MFRGTSASVISRSRTMSTCAGAAQRSGSTIIPNGWAEWFDEQSLGATDPVHRASNITSVGFAWSRLPDMIASAPTTGASSISPAARGSATASPFPPMFPGEAHGSCSFACAADDPFSERHLSLLQLVGAFAFEAARRIAPSALRGACRSQLTDRQRECVMWAARGKSDWEIARILGISHETVIEHLRHARERYGVGKRTLARGPCVVRRHDRLSRRAPPLTSPFLGISRPFRRRDDRSSQTGERIE